MELVLRFSFLFVCLIVFAAPVMGAKRPREARNISIKGELFEFSNLKTSWWKAPVPADKEGVSMLFRAPVLKKPNGFRPIMTVRLGKTDKNVASYVASWMGDYAKLGYEVLGSRSFSHKKNSGYVVDVKNPNTNKQARQVIFLKDQNSVILTCVDKIKSFKSSLSECNKIVRSFNWVSI